MKQNRQMAAPIIDTSTFVISDCHFGHKNALNFEPIRAEFTKAGGFNSQEEMMVEHWNSVVGTDDEVLVLGDFAFNGIEKWTKLLNGHKYLIRGNHDRPNRHAYINAGFEYVFDTVTYLDRAAKQWDMHTDDTYLSALIIGDTMFSHYPIHFYEEYYTKQRRDDLTLRIKKLSDLYDHHGCTMNVHGHVHSMTLDDDRYVNVSTEVLKFKPKRIRELLYEEEG